MKQRLLDNIIVYYFWVLVLTVIGQSVGGILMYFIAGIAEGIIPAAKDSDAWQTFCFYAVFIGMWAATLLFLRISKKNRFILKKYWTGEKGNNIKWLLIGLVIGFVLNGACILIAALHKDIYLYYDSFRPISFIFVFIAVFVQSSAEEILCRGYLYQKLLTRYKKPVVAIVGNSLFFALLHLANEGVTVLSLLNIFLSGVLMSLAVYYFDSIWCAFAIHTGWNFTQNILFGLPNSGNVMPYSVMKLDASTAMDSFAYNVGFGIEGTVTAVLSLLIGCVVLFLIGRKNMPKTIEATTEVEAEIKTVAVEAETAVNADAKDEVRVETETEQNQEQE